MTAALQSALHLAPLPAIAWETTEDMFRAVDGYLSPAARLVICPWILSRVVAAHAQRVVGLYDRPVLIMLFISYRVW